MRRFITFLFAVCSLTLLAQNQSNQYCWVKFKDKKNNGYSLSNPVQFLSQRSIDRRNSQGIALDTTDLPITQSYIDSILPYAVKLVHKLKWFNIVVVQVGDSTMADSIRRFSFVDSVAPIITFPYRALSFTNKFESVTSVNQQIVYPDIHGAAYHQLNMMNVDLLHQLGYKGTGVLIAMMDNGWTGVDSFQAFDSVRSHIMDAWNFVTGQQDIYNDPQGEHGEEALSCMAANIPYKYVGSAPYADFDLFHTEDNYAEWVMEEYNWGAAAERADSDGAQIFTTSLGYTTFNDNLGNHTFFDLTGNKTFITMAGNIAASKGILVFNAAGNEGDKPWYNIIAPADGDSIIAIGAVDSTRTLGAFSSRGPNASGQIKPDLCAQGAVVAVINTIGQPGTSGGTSFSCPTMAGAAACLWQAFPDKTARQIREAIYLSADRYTTPNNNYGYGIPNFYNAYLFLKTNYNGHILRINSDAVVYPNPFTSQLNVSLFNTNAGSRTIELYNLLGQKVLTRQVFLRDNTFEIVTLDEAGNLPAGEYFVRIDGQKDFTHGVIKAK